MPLFSPGQFRHWSNRPYHDFQNRGCALRMRRWNCQSHDARGKNEWACSIGRAGSTATLRNIFLRTEMLISDKFDTGPGTVQTQIGLSWSAVILCACIFFCLTVSLKVLHFEIIRCIGFHFSICVSIYFGGW